jgi:outer membrane protein TolC
LPQQLPRTLPAELAHRRPDILAAEAQLHAATAAVGIAAANLYPQISLTATASLQATALHALFDSNSTAGGLTGSLTSRCSTMARCARANGQRTMPCSLARQLRTGGVALVRAGGRRPGGIGS